MKKNEEERKNAMKTVIEALKEPGDEQGIVGLACGKAGISPRSYYNWYHKYPEFKAEADAARGLQCDNVEKELLNQIFKKHNTKATIFYLKTRGRDRGYGEKYVPETEQEKKKKKVSKKIIGMYNGIRTRLIKTMKDMGTYDDSKIWQIELAADAVTRLRLLRREMYSEDYHTIITERSREGNTRETVSPLEQLFRIYLTQAQSALRGLGLNTDSRQKVEGGDEMNEFMDAMNDEDEG